MPKRTRLTPALAPPLSAPVFQILLSLVDQELHGYAIIQDIETRTVGDVRLTASTLYDALYRLVQAGAIEEVAAPAVDDDPRRRYYGITDAGKSVARAEASRYEQLTRSARQKKLLPALKPSARRHP